MRITSTFFLSLLALASFFASPASAQHAPYSEEEFDRMAVTDHGKPVPHLNIKNPGLGREFEFKISSSLPVLDSPVDGLLLLSPQKPVVFSNSQIPWPYIDVTAFPYNAACDGTTFDDTGTDDSVPLQDAINNSSTLHLTVGLPPGRVCVYSTTLTSTGFSMTTAGTSSAGSSTGAFGVSATVLHYIGTGDGIVVSNSPFASNVSLGNFELENSSHHQAQRGIVFQNGNQIWMNNVFVIGAQSIQTQTFGWTIAFDFENSFGLVADNLSFADVGFGFKIVNSSNFNIARGLTFGANADFYLANVTGIWIHDGLNYEVQNYFILMDNTVLSGFTNNQSVRVNNNYILMDQAGSSTPPYAPCEILHVNNTLGNVMDIQDMSFTDNHLEAPNVTGGCSPAYAFDVNIAGAGLTWISIQQNNLSSVTTAAINSVTNGSAYYRFKENYSIGWFTGLATIPDFQGQGTINGEFSTGGSITVNPWFDWLNVSGNSTVTYPHNMLGHPVTVMNTNIGSGTVTVKCDSGLINGASNNSLGVNQSEIVTADGTNCWAVRSQ